MTRTPLIIAIVAAAALAGCGSENHTIVAGGPDEGQPTNAAANANVTLPPTIAASKIYRCSGDNSVVYVDWLSDGSANLRTDQEGSRTRLASAEAGKPLTNAGGLSLTGTAAESSISVTIPGQRSKRCHV